MGTPSATVYVDYKGTPHTFIKLDNGNGIVNYYGFAPEKPGSMFGAGTVGNGLTTHGQGDPNNSKAGYIDDVFWSNADGSDSSNCKRVDSPVCPRPQRRAHTGACERRNTRNPKNQISKTVSGRSMR